MRRGAFQLSDNLTLCPWPNLAQRALTALVALALLCAGVRLAARASPPFNPPLRPRATAALFFFMTLVYVTALV